MCRSQSDPRAACERVAVAGRMSPAAGEAAVRACRARRRRREAFWLSASAASVVSEPGARSVVVLGEPGDSGGGELGLRVDAGRGGGGRSGGVRPRARSLALPSSGRGRRSPLRRGSRLAARVRGRACECTRRGEPRAGRTAVRKAAASAAGRAPSRAARRACGSRRARPAARALATRARSAAACALARREARVDARARRSDSRRGSARAAAAAVSGDEATSASIRPEQPRALRLPRRIAEPLRRRRSSRPRWCSRSRSARYERLGRPGSKPWTTSYRPRESAIVRFARSRPARPCCCAGRSGPRGRRRSPPRRRRRPASAARRGGRRPGSTVRAPSPSGRASAALRRRPRRGRSPRAAPTTRTA